MVEEVRSRRGLWVVARWPAFHLCRARRAPDTPATSNYTVLSKVPWFTALALYPQRYSWRGGGGFLDNVLYRVYEADGASDIVGRAEGLYQVVDGPVTKDCRTGLRLRNGQAAPLSKPLRARLLAGDPPPKSDALDHYETRVGRLYRRRGMELKLIRDFTDMAPCFEPAPYSVDPVDDDQPWHPADNEGPR